MIARASFAEAEKPLLRTLPVRQRRLARLASATQSP
ncbi:hypothetical protein C357_16516 [Citreicella sp. 357]|nr:hypothetical protein C357_16516 [Citreicella sp. 357]